MKFRILFILILFSGGLCAQWHFDTCPMDSTTNLELRYELSALGESGDSLFIRTSVTNADSVNCEPFRFDWKTYTVSNYSGEISFQCRPEKITKLRVILFNVDSYDHTFKLDTMEMLNSLFLPQLKQLSIEGNPNFTIHFDEWKMYDELVKGQSLKSIIFEGKAINTDWLNPFIAFKSITEIQVNDNLSTELNAFPNLERLSMSNTYHHFSHPIVNILNLKEMPSLEIMSLRQNDLYPQISYFASALSPDIIGHPYYEIAKSIEEKLELDSTYTGTLVLTYKDVHQGYFDSRNENDSVAFGQVIKGHPVGGWQFKIPGFQAFEEDGWYSYNYSDSLSVGPPDNGSWRYSYPDGTLAISGEFKNGKKHGEWRFCNPDGFLVSVRNYEMDRLIGLFISYQTWQGEIVESRSYFFSSGKLIFGSSNKDQGYFLGGNRDISGKKYGLTNYGKLVKYAGSDEEVEVPKDSREYKKVLTKYLKLLYPEKKLSIKDVSFLKP